MGDEHEADHDVEHDDDGALPEVDAEAVAEEVEESDEQLEREEHGEVAAEADDEVHAQAEEQPQPDEPADGADAGASDELRGALGEMRQEADRIAALETGDEQVEAAEQFAEDAGKLDEQIGSAARAADDDDRQG